MESLWGSGVTVADVRLWVCWFGCHEHTLIPNFCALMSGTA